MWKIKKIEKTKNFITTYKRGKEKRLKIRRKKIKIDID